MRSTAWYRLDEKIQFSLLIAGMVAILIAFVPNYEAILYDRTEPVNDTHNYVGYPAGDEVPVLESLEEIEKETHVFTVEVDAERVKPLGVYYGLGVYDRVSKFSNLRFLNKLDNEKVYGQYFSVELDDGGQIVVLLDDLAVKIPRSGRVKLPRGELEKLGEISKEYLEEKTGKSKNSFKYYIDAAGSWRSLEGGKYVGLRTFLLAICFIVGTPLAYVFFLILAKNNKEAQEAKTNSSNRMPARIKKNTTQAWFKFEEIKEKDYKPTLQEKIEASMDQFAKRNLPSNYDWRKDKRRSWTRFGAGLVYLGFMMMAFFVWVFFFQRNQLFAIFYVMLFIGAVMFVAGIRVRRWAKPEKPDLSPIDQNLDYRFTLMFHEKKEFVQDFSKVEEAFQSFCGSRKAWSLTSEPPIGGLSEWKCYYSETNGYVTEITLMKRKKVQKWKRYDVQPPQNNLNGLRKILVQMKKVQL